MAETSDLQLHINAQQIFFVNEKIISRFSGKLRRIIKQEKRRTQIRTSGIDLDDFPGGPEGFEMVSRFCYNNGQIEISVSNVSILHCCAVFLGMTEKMHPRNLLHQTEIFLQGLFYWSWNDILTCLKSSETFFSYADSCGLVQKLMLSLLAKITQNSDMAALLHCSSPSSSSSPELRLSSCKTTPEKLLPKQTSSTSSSSSGKVSWWFDDMTVLSPDMIDRFVKILGGYGNGNDNNNNLVLTRFLLHYLKTAAQSQGYVHDKIAYSGIAETAAYGAILIGRSAFSCRALFWVLRIVSGFGLSRETRMRLERLIAGVLDQASLDDLLVTGRRDGGVYDVSLVLRLIRLFVHHEEIPASRRKKVGRLVDKYLGEIAPDQSLKVSKFLGVAESLPDCARDCFDGVYRAIDIYLESHPALSLEERSRICRCLNYEKLSLEACKDLAKNPRIPPRVAVQALASQRPNPEADYYSSLSTTSSTKQMVVYNDNNKLDNDSSTRGGGSSSPDKSEEMRLNLRRMQWRVVELEKVCKEMKGQMSRMARGGGAMIAPGHTRALPRLC